MMHTALSQHPGPRSGSDEGRRTGAIWTGATGAFLLVAAATLFLAMRWDTVPPAARLGVVAGAAGASLLAGRALRPSLPAVATVLFHLGAFLVPVAATGVGIHLELAWPELFLLAGTAGWATFELLAASERSVVLRWGGDAAAVAALIGAGPVTGAPSALLLASVAVLGLAAARERSALGWAAIAALHPLLAALSSVEPDMAADLGASGQPLAVTGWITGVVAGGVLAVIASRRRDPVVASLALSSVALGVAASLGAADLPEAMAPVAAASAFLMVELLAGLTRRDAFWAPITARTAEVAEVVAGVASLGAVTGAVALATSDLPGNGHLAASLGIAALAWLVADLRRVEEPAPAGWALLLGSGWPIGAVAVTGSLATASLALWGASPATAATWLGLSAVVVMTGRPLAGATASLLAVPGPLLAAAEPAQAAPLAAAGGLVVAYAAVLLWRSGSSGVDESMMLAVAAAVSALMTGGFAGEAWDGRAGVAIAMATAWALALLLDTAHVSFGHPARLVVAASAVIAGGQEPSAALAITALATVMLLVDAVRHGRPTIAYGAAVSVQAAAWSLARLAELDGPHSGVLLVVAAVTWAGVALLLPREWSHPAWAAAALSGVAGLSLTMGDPHTASVSLLAVGAAGVAAGVARRDQLIGHIGGVLMVMGTWIRLDLSGVEASELFVAPVALQLVIAGALIRRRHQLSSWAAYAPAIGLMGLTSLAERAAGGDPWHSLAAGLVSVVAVGTGGTRRLAGPLITGTLLVVASTAQEALLLDVSIPTWAWMAAGGLALIGSAVAIERSAVSPLATGRRLVEVVQDRFE